ncbi:MAG: competence/damage-inducible protein A [Rickettsiales bacterium]|nr:competence/damage-inducible protein A [Rickettsiales bacterium]
MEAQPTAAYIIIGNEILSGRTKESNLCVLAEELNSIGIALQEVRVIPDVVDAIVETVNALRPKYDYIFTSGGIGPTHDDLTCESIAKAFDVPVVAHPEAWKLLETHYAAKDQPFTEGRQKMAKVPEGASLIPNALTLAPGFILGNVYVMAGVPAIFQSMVAEIKSVLRTGRVAISRSIIVNMKEGDIAGLLQDIQMEYPDVQIGSYPSFREGERSVNVVLRGLDELRVNEATAKVKTALRHLGGIISSA